MPLPLHAQPCRIHGVAARPTVQGGFILIDIHSRRGRGRVRRRDGLATVTDLDRRLLTLLAEQRVLTQTQLERLLANTAARTLRYRTERLTKLGLVGRSRPYRDKGSAPFHYWPTRASDAFVRGEPVPGGGERAEPNPQFLHHAERLSELYALLAVQAPTAGLHLHEFKREGDAREVFRADGRERALAPDALAHLHDDTGRDLLAFVELDMGTMSHARLKTKAAGYAAYAAQAAWTERHPFCPCLLFLTTTEARALAFLKMLAGLLDRHGRGNYYNRRRGFFDWFEAASCAHARQPERALDEPCWDDLVLAGGGLTLVECLNKARAAYDGRRVEEEAEERSRDAERERLRGSPEALRAHLVEKRLRLDRQLEQFGAAGAAALELLLASTEPMNEPERARVRRDRRANSTTTSSNRDPLGLRHRRRGPRRRRWSCWSRATGAASVHASRSSPAATESDRCCAASAKTSSAASCSAAHLDRPRRLRAARRESTARPGSTAQRLPRQPRRKKRASASSNSASRHGSRTDRAALYPAIDRERLRVCQYCDEIAYPDAEASRDQYGRTSRQPAGRCHFCGSSNLAAWNPTYQTRVEYGEMARFGGDDLTFAGNDWLHGRTRQRGRGVRPVMRVCLYQRISTDEDHQPTSLKTQRERLERYCEAMEDWRIVAAYEDQATGTSLDRPGLQQALDLAREKRIDLLLVYRVDRLSRKVRQLAGLCEELDQLDVVLKSATEPFDTGSAAGRMMLQMLGVFAEFEHATIVDRVTAGLERRVREGKWMSGRTPVRLHARQRNEADRSPTR